MSTDRLAIPAAMICPCGAHGELLEGASFEDRQEWDDWVASHDACEPRAATPADVLPDADALAALIPDSRDVAWAIKDAEYGISRASLMLHPRVDLARRMAEAESQVAYAARVGRDLATLRVWALLSALLRDAHLTPHELEATR